MVSIMLFRCVYVQVRFCMKFLTREKELPSREEMLRETNDEMEKRWAKGYKKRQAHMMGPVQVSIKLMLSMLNFSVKSLNFFFYSFALE